MVEKDSRLLSRGIDTLDETMRALQGVAGVLCDMSTANEHKCGHVWDYRSLMLLSDVVEQQVSELSEVRKMVFEATETASKAS